MQPSLNPQTPGQSLYDAGQQWLRDNDATMLLTRWGQIRAHEQLFWEALGKAIQTELLERRWDGFFVGLTFGFVIAATVFIFAMP